MTGRQQLARLVSLGLLLLLAAVGLRGESGGLGWSGPLRADGVVIGLILEAVLGVLLTVTLVRDAAARRAAKASPAPEPPSGAPAAADGPDVPASLRWVLKWVLGAGMVAVAGLLIASVHLHLFAGLPPRHVPPARLGTPPKPPPVGRSSSGTLRLPLAEILYGLLIAALAIAAAASVWWAARLRAPAPAAPAGNLAEDSEDLRDAIAEGRAALAELDDARAAIIACYSAMERSLAERGTARNAADTPDELLDRAAVSGITRGPAAGELTALFYEARFSSHPLGPGQRDAARDALDALAAELASPAKAAP